MPENDQSFNPNIEKQEMRSYLLGSLSPDRRTELEARIVSDADLYEELLVTEDELIDQYLAGSLSGIEKQRFETHFLITPERQKKLHFGRLFEKYRNTHVPVTKEEPPTTRTNPAPITPALPTSAPLFATFNRNPAFAVSLMAVVGLLVTAIGWLLINRSQGSTALNQSVPPIVVTLTPGSMRSGGVIQHVPAPPKGVDVKLELEVAKSDYKKYRTQLFRENEALQTKEDLKTEPRGTRHVVPVTVAGGLLTPGDYQLKLSGILDSGQPEFVDRYSFRVTTE